MSRFLTLLSLLLYMSAGLAAEATQQQSKPADKTVTQPSQQQLEQQVDKLKKPLYTPFIERYVLDELRQLRTDMGQQKAELIQQIVDREITSVDKAVTYSTDTVTYFFYLIAGATSILVLVGWSSIREIKERVHTLADEEISKLVNEYERRLHVIEQQLNQETLNIEENREQIEQTREVQSLWLRAGQESNPANKILVYDQILKLKPDDCEAITYKADAVLELNEPQWAANLCHQALAIDSDNGHAFYQLGCAYTTMEQFDDAVYYLREAIDRNEIYREQINNDAALTALSDYPPLQKLLKSDIDS